MRCVRVRVWVATFSGSSSGLPTSDNGCATPNPVGIRAGFQRPRPLSLLGTVGCRGDVPGGPRPVLLDEILQEQTGG